MSDFPARRPPNNDDDALRRDLSSRADLEKAFAEFKTPSRKAQSKLLTLPGVRELVAWTTTTRITVGRSLRNLQDVGGVVPAHQLLLVLNLIIFIMQQTVYPTFTLAGARINALILNNNQLHRLITPIFLHGGWRHLLFNSFSLWNIGQHVESIFGTKRFWLIYLGSGLAGNLMGLEYGGRAPSVGASGAIFGLIGAMLVWVRRTQELRMGIGQTIGRSLFITILIGLIPHGRVDQWAHLGGLIGGLVLGAIFAPWKWGKGRSVGSGRGYIIEPSGDEAPFVPEKVVNITLAVLVFSTFWAIFVGLDYANMLNQARDWGLGRRTFQAILEQPPRSPGLWRFF